MQRDRGGRFVKGNTISHAGWKAMVAQRFGDNEGLAREWWGRIGAHTYARMSGAGFSLQLKESFAHPGTPEEFVAKRKGG